MKNEKLRSFLLRTIPYAIAFVLAFAIGVLAYWVMGVAPFGDKTIIGLDLWAQYFPMYAEKQQMESLAELFYSWNGSLGFNQWAQSAYYTNSIFTLLLPLIPAGSLVAFINWLAIVKIALSAVTCLGFLQYKTQSRTPFLVGGAVAYATCAYMLAFLHQIMWTDCVIYLPLLLIGLERLIHEKKTLLYTLMLAAIIITNFYIGFAICIFSCLYFAANVLPMARFEKNKRSTKSRYTLTNAGELGFSVLRFSVFSILGGAISAAVILPIGLALSHAISTEITGPEKLEWYGNISTILQHMLPEQELSLQFDGFNLSVGIAVFILVPMYFLNEGIPVKERIADGCLLAFLGLSLLCNFLDYFWHGMHFPNQLPARWSFMFSLVLILLACKGIVKIRESSVPFGVISIGIGFLAVILGVKGYGDTESVTLGALHWILLSLTAALLLAVITFSENRSARKDNKKTKIRRIFASVCTVLMAAAMVFESGYSYIAVYHNTKHQFFKPRENEYYLTSYERESRYGNAYQPDSEDFYRVAANGGYVYDSPMLGSYPGVSYYSSTMRGSSYMLMQHLGNRVYAKNVSSLYNPVSPVQNSLFGIRYLLDYKQTMNRYISHAEIVEDGEDGNVLENKTALSLGYAVSEDILDLNITDEVRAIQNQNELLNLLCGEDMDVFKKLNTTNFSYLNANLGNSSNWNTLYFTQNGTGTPTFYYTYTCEKDGLFYLENNFRAGTMLVQWDGGERKLYPDDFKFESLGYFNAGDEISITVTIDGYKKGCCGLNLYYFDEDAWQNAYDRLSAEELKVDTFKNTYIKGEIDLAGERLLMTTIPQDGGWTVYCDGKKTEPVLIADELIGVRIPEGSHTLEFRYRVPGLALGAVISVLGLLLTFGLTSTRLRKALAGKKSEGEGK